jgi:aryl-alcohol dehydrogenase-like predicted oxidoreductase
VERSLKNLDTDCVDLLQLHCPHPDVYDRAEVFGYLDELVAQGKIRYYGISVETVDEALRGIRHPGVQSVQIIFNMLRHKPAERFFGAAKQRSVGILARVPLASGLLTGRMTKDSTFEADDHRRFNRNGEAFDKGETFSGVPFDVGLAVVERLRPLVPEGATLAQLALRWTLMFDAVTCAIPGAKTPEQARANAASAGLAPLPPETMRAVERIYDEAVRPLVHASW